MRRRYRRKVKLKGITHYPSAQIGSLLTVDTKRSKRKAVEWMRGRFIEALFLDLPTSWEDPIENIAR